MSIFELRLFLLSVNVLKRQLNQLGDIVRVLREYNEQLNGEDEMETLRSKKMNVKELSLYPEAAANPFEIAKWERKKKGMQITKQIKQRSSHMEGKVIQRISRKLNLHVTNSKSDKKEPQKQKKKRKISLSN